MLILICLCAIPAKGDKGERGKVSVAVYPVKARGKADKSLASALTPILVTELNKSPNILVVESTLVERALETLGYNQSDMCDDTACRTDVGKQLQIQKMIMCDLTKWEKKYSLSIRVIDVESTKVQWSASEECYCTADELDQLATSAALTIRKHFGETDFKDKPLPTQPISTGSQPARPTVKGTGTLMIESKPKGADIYLNAELKGKTPKTMNRVPAGTHSLSIVRKGYSPLIKEVVVAANQTTNVYHLLLTPNSITLVAE